MEEPSRTNAHVDFGRPPVETVGFGDKLAASEIGAHAIDVESGVDAVGVGDGMGGERGDAPLGLASLSGLVAYPAHIFARDGYNGIGLQPVDHIVEAHEVIFLFFTVGAFAACAVEPYFVNLAVVGEKLGELGHEQVVIGRGIAVGRSVAVPGGEVEAEFHVVFVARLAECFHYVALAIHP